MAGAEASCRLYLNDKVVGTVKVRGCEASWHYGDFEPGEEFKEFATVFGRWSLLMHADDGSRLSQAASEELREAEYDMDRLRAQVYFPDREEWRKVAQLNIDGGLIEWKEY